MLRIVKTLLLIFWIPLACWIFKDQLLSYIDASPWLSVVYAYVREEIGAKSFTGVAISQFFGNLIFIVFLPRYLVFAYFMKTGELSTVLLVVSSACGLVVAMICNYIMGFLLGFVFRGQSENRLGAALDRFGWLLVFVGYLFPMGFPCTLLSFIAGTSRVSPVKFLLSTVFGSLVYFIILVSCQNWIMSIYEKANFVF